MLGVVLGSGAAGLDLPEGVVAIDRHGDPYRLPHRIDHAENLGRLARGGCDRVIGVSSVGGLRPKLVPGTVVLPDDFIGLDAPYESALRGAAAHVVPAFDPAWRDRVLAALRSTGDVVDGGVYWQVRGPRLETAAEVRFAAPHADVIGMTVASECVAAVELGLAYAAVCMVDNLANGIDGTHLEPSAVIAGQARHRPTLAEVLAGALPELA